MSNSGKYKFEGVGHQFKAEEKAWEDSRQKLQEVYNQIHAINTGGHYNEMLTSIDKLMKDCLSNEVALNDSYNERE